MFTFTFSPTSLRILFLYDDNYLMFGHYQFTDCVTECEIMKIKLFCSSLISTTSIFVWHGLFHGCSGKTAHTKSIKSRIEKVKGFEKVKVENIQKYLEVFHVPLVLSWQILAKVKNQHKIIIFAVCGHKTWRSVLVL